MLLNVIMIAGGDGTEPWLRALVCSEKREIAASRLFTAGRHRHLTHQRLFAGFAPVVIELNQSLTIAGQYCAAATLPPVARSTRICSLN